MGQQVAQLHDRYMMVMMMMMMMILKIKEHINSLEETVEFLNVIFSGAYDIHQAVTG
jgi:hypothetical protein